MTEQRDVYLAGARVRFTTGPLGLIKHPTQSKFEDESVNAGDEGSYIGPHPRFDEEGWHLVAVGDKLLCPCHHSQFEVVR
jgi:hypothetical protein